jgi:hypothetical protein
MVARAKSDGIIIKGGSYLSFEIGILILEYINSNIVVVKREGVDSGERILLKELVLPIFDKYPLWTSK